MSVPCGHLDLVVVDVLPDEVAGCDDCLRIGSGWVHLRICLTCGHVGCCDASKNKHATKHFEKIRHPVIQSFEPDERWVWCFVDEVGFE